MRSMKSPPALRVNNYVNEVFQSLLSFSHFCKNIIQQKTDPLILGAHPCLQEDSIRCLPVHFREGISGEECCIMHNKEEQQDYPFRKEAADENLTGNRVPCA